MGNSPSNSKKKSSNEGSRPSFQGNQAQIPPGFSQNPQYGQGHQQNNTPNSNQNYSRNTQNPPYTGNQQPGGNNPMNYQGMPPSNQYNQSGSQTQGNAQQNVQRPPQNFQSYQGGNQSSGNPPQNLQNQRPPYSQPGFQPQSSNQNPQFQGERSQANYGNPNQPPPLPQNQPPLDSYGNSNYQNYSNPQNPVSPSFQNSYPPNQPPIDSYGKSNYQNYSNPQNPALPPSQNSYHQNQPPLDSYGKPNYQNYSNPQSQGAPPSQNSYPSNFPQNNQQPNYTQNSPQPNYPQNAYYNKDYSQYPQNPSRNVNAVQYPQNLEYNNSRMDLPNQIPPYYSEQEYKVDKPYYPNAPYYKDQYGQFLPAESYKPRSEPQPYSNTYFDPLNYNSSLPLSSGYNPIPVEQNQFQNNYQDYNVYSPPSAFPSGAKLSPYRSRTPIPSGRLNSPQRLLQENYDKFGNHSPFIGENARIISSRIITNPYKEGYQYDSYYNQNFYNDIIPPKNVNVNQSYDFSNVNFPTKSKLISRQILDPTHLSNMPQYFPSKTYSPQKLGLNYKNKNTNYEVPNSQQIERSLPLSQRKNENIIEPASFDDQLISSNRIPRATLANLDFTSQNQSKRDVQIENSSGLKPSGGSKFLKNK